MSIPPEGRRRRPRRPRFQPIDVLVPIAALPILAGAVATVAGNPASPASGYYLGLSILGIWAGLRYDRRGGGER